MNRAALYYISTLTIIMRECRRFLRLWHETFIPPAITMTLYFLIFGKLVGSQVGGINNHTYMQFITPGLIMMSTITSSYMNVSFHLFHGKFQKNIEELLVSPMPLWGILIGYVIGGVLRGLITAVIIGCIALFFTHLHFAHIGITLLTAVLCATFFSLAGFTNGLLARNFEDIGVIPTFVLTPLTYLGGVFFALEMLSPFWQKLALINPVLYIVNAFRYGVLGISDIPVTSSLLVLTLFAVGFFGLNLYLLAIGKGIRT